MSTVATLTISCPPWCVTHLDRGGVLEHHSAPVELLVAGDFTDKPDRLVAVATASDWVHFFKGTVERDAVCIDVHDVSNEQAAQDPALRFTSAEQLRAFASDLLELANQLEQPDTA